jgi:hypothetical protein
MNMASLKPSEAAKLLNVSVKTLQRWDRDGILKAQRTITNRRYYTMSQILEHKGESDSEQADELVVFEYSGGSPLLDEIMNDPKKQVATGMHYSASTSKFLCKKEKIEEVKKEFDFDDEECIDIGRFLEFEFEAEDEIEIQYGFSKNEKIGLSLQGWSETTLEPFDYIENFNDMKDWYSWLKSSAIQMILDGVELCVEGSINSIRKSLE